MPEIIFEYSGWWLLPVAILSALLSFWLYGKSSTLSRPQKLILAFLRFSIFFILGVLLLSPLLRKDEERIDKPILVWLEDRSLSMLKGPDSAAVRALGELDQQYLQDLEEKYTLDYLSFTNNLSQKTDSFSSVGTNLYQPLGELQDRYYNRNLAGAVLISDGIYNQGSDPSFLAERLPFPVFSVIAGDSTKRRDLLIERVIHNKVTYLNNEFPVEIYLRARAMPGRQYQLRIIDPAGRTLINESYEIDSDDYFKRVSFYLEAVKEGFQRYTVVLESDELEEPLQNNHSAFSIEVLSNRKQVLLLADAPHPDLGAIANALQSAEQYELTTTIAKRLPTEQNYDLIILHQPNAEVLKAVANTDLPYWLFLGPTTNTQGFAPFQAGSKGYEESQVYPNGEFDLFSLADQELELINELPPLWSPFGTPAITGEYYPLLYKRISSIKTLDPTWLFRYDQRASARERRSAVVLGTGLWRWRMYSFRQKESFEAFDQLILKTVQFLTTRSRTDRFDVNIANRFGRSERIMGEARLYNSSMELVNEPEASIQFNSQGAEVYDFAMNRSGNTYRINAGSLPPGLYSWRATATLGDENFEDVGKLLVEEELRELADLVSRPQVLRRISEASGGQLFTTNEAEALKEALLSNQEAQSYRSVESVTRSLIESKWPFVLLLLVMTLEWGLRKYFGRY